MQATPTQNDPPVPTPGFVPVTRPRWLTELIAAWGFAQRNYYLTKRYIWWELVWLLYTTMNAMSIGFIGAGVNGVTNGRPVDTATLTTFLLLRIAVRN